MKKRKRPLIHLDVRHGRADENRAAIAPFVETVNGPTVSALRGQARSLKVYLCIGIAMEKVSG